MTQFHVTTDPTQLDIAAIHRFLSEEAPWARGVPIDVVRKGIENSLNFGLFVDGKQVAYARVVTDHATFAYLVDVFVLDEFRGRGLGRELITCVMQHPSVKTARRVMLVSSTARGLYEKFGFAPPAKPEIFMEINVPDAYRNV